MDKSEIEAIPPAPIPQGLAISRGKQLAKFKREICGVNEDLLGPSKKCDNKGKIMACENDKCAKYGMHHDYKNGVKIRKCQFCIRDDPPEPNKPEDIYQNLAKEYIDSKESWETNPSEKISIECFASWLDRRCGALNTELKDKNEDIK